MSINKYLEKLAEKNADQEDGGRKKSYALPTASVLAGGATLRSATPNLLGYKVIYHGTTKKNAERIKETGFDPSRGGSNNANLDSDFKRQSSGKIHFTENKRIARVFSHSNTAKIDPSTREGIVHAINVAANPFSRTDGKVLKARVPDRIYSKSFTPDPHMGNGNSKSLASTFDKKIDSKFIAGGEGSKGVLEFMNKRHLKSLIRTKTGRKNLVLGAKKVGVGMALAGVGGHTLLNRIRSNPKEA